MRAAIIPCRGGSRRIPRKNFRSFHGKPIIAYSVQVALDSGLFDGGVWVSAEEADWGEIMVACPGSGVIRRQPEFARDEVGTQEVIRHALIVMETERNLEKAALGSCRPMPKSVCCIYPTAPMMTVGDLRRGLGMLASGITPYVYSVGPDGKDAGQWYWGEAAAFLDGVPLAVHSQHMVLPAERVCDINVEEDWTRAERMYQELQDKVT